MKVMKEASLTGCSHSRVRRAPGSGRRAGRVLRTHGAACLSARPWCSGDCGPPQTGQSTWLERRATVGSGLS